MPNKKIPNQVLNKSSLVIFHFLTLFWVNILEFIIREATKQSEKSLSDVIYATLITYKYKGMYITEFKILYS